MRLQHEGAASLELAADGQLRIRAQRALAAGAELTLEAAAFGHAALMLRQGTPGDGGGAPTSFSDAVAGHERAGPGAVPLPLLLGDDDPLHAVKSVLLSKLGLRPEGETFELRQGMPPPPRLMAYARLLVLEASAPQPNSVTTQPRRSPAIAVLPLALQEHDLHLLRPSELPLMPLGPANEHHAIRLVAVRVEARLAAYPTTLDEDEYALRQALATSSAISRRVGALRGLVLEKRLLAATLAHLRAALHHYLSYQHVLLPTPDQSRGVYPTTQARATSASTAAAAASGTPCAIAAQARSYKGGETATTCRCDAASAFNLSVEHAPVGLQLARRPAEGTGCAQLMVVAVLASSLTGDVSAALGMVVHRVGQRAAAGLSVRTLQQRLLQATPQNRVALELLPMASAKSCQV